jgi:muconolactone delta-isomerase
MSDQPTEAGQPPAPQPQQPPAEPASEAGQETFSKEYVQELRQEAAQRRTALKEMQEQYQQLEAQLKEQQTAQEKAKETQLKEQGKYKELFEEASQKLAKFSDVDKQSARMQEAISAVLQTQRDGIPDHITALLDKLDPVEQLEWLANYRQTLAAPEPQKPQGKQTAQQQLAGFNPTGGNGTQESDQQRIARLQQKAGVGVSIFGSQR